MLKMLWLFHLLFLYLLGLTGAGQESYELLNVYGSSSGVLQAMPDTGVPVGVCVSDEDLSEVSKSVLLAESWVRTHVLAHFPATNISTIVVGDPFLCNESQKDKMGLVLPSLKNIFHSLSRWGLEKEIKVSVAFSSGCLLTYSAGFNDDIPEKIVKPLLHFLQSTNSPFSISPPPDFSHSSDETLSLVSSHLEFIKKFGFLDMNKIIVISLSAKESKPTSRKLSFIDSTVAGPFPARPNPLPESPPSLNPLPPLPGIASPPSMSFSFGPEQPPTVIPASPPYGPSLPPCNPFAAMAPAPVTGVSRGLWCVAKPNVPSETLQVAMDYACGEGGADCDELRPHGNCYHPDTVVAHASYAFNNYWQKNKKIGGTCNFGGTAMLINSDPSFLHCRFVLTLS